MLRLVVAVLAITTATFVSGKQPGPLTHVSGNRNYIWAVDSEDDIFVCQRPCTGAWKKIPGKLVQVDMCDDEVMGIGNIWARPTDGSGYWRLLPFHGKMSHVSASGRGYVWGVNEKHQA